MEFNPGFGIHPQADPLGFQYDADVFGPMVEQRTLDAIRSSLMAPHCDGPQIVYAIAMDVGKEADRASIVNRNLLYGAVTYAKGMLGNEPVRSQGHIHAISPSCGASTCELYEIWEGSACIYMQESAADNPGRCFAVLANVGDVVLVPPGWAHCTITADVTKNTSFGAWCVRDYGFEYQDVREHKGLAWFPIVQEGALTFVRNPHYEHSLLITKEPRDYREFKIEQGKPIYTQFTQTPDRFLFVAQPELADNQWIDFIP